MKAATWPVEPPDDKHIPIADVVQRLLQSGTICAGTGGVILEHFRATRYSEGVKLQSGILIESTYSGVTDRPPVPYNHRRARRTIWHQVIRPVVDAL